MLNPDDEIHMRWLAGNDQLMLRISRPLVERALVAQVGRELDEPLRFELGFRWRDSGPWLGLLSYLSSCAAQAQELTQHRLVLAQIEQLAAAVLLASAPPQLQPGPAGAQQRRAAAPCAQGAGIPAGPCP